MVLRIIANMTGQRLVASFRAISVSVSAKSIGKRRLITGPTYNSSRCLSLRTLVDMVSCLFAFASAPWFSMKGAGGGMLTVVQL